MNAQEFAYWLQGFAEMNPDLAQPTPDQWKMIKEHLSLVFTKVTPPLGEPKVWPTTVPVSPPFTPTMPGYPSTPWWENPYKVTCTGLDGITIC